MAGRMGSDTVTTQNLTVHAVDAEKGLILVKGAVPGPKGGLDRAPLGCEEPGGLTQMATKTVKVDLPGRDLRRPGQHPADPPGRRRPAGGRPPGHPLHQDPRRGPRRWPQALQAEGHRPRPPGLDPRAAVRRRWRRPRPAAAQLRPAHPQEDEGRRPARCPLRPGPQRPDPRGRRPGPGRQALDQGGARRAGRPGRPQPLPRGARAHRRRHLALAAQRARGAHRGRRPAQHLRRAGRPTTWSSPRAPTTRSSARHGKGGAPRGRRPPRPPAATEPSPTAEGRGRRPRPRPTEAADRRREPALPKGAKAPLKSARAPKGYEVMADEAAGLYREPDGRGLRRHGGRASGSSPLRTPRPPASPASEEGDK